MLFISMTLLPAMNGAPAMNASGTAVCMHVCSRVRLHACVHAHMRVCVRTRAGVYAHMRVCMCDVFAIYDNIFDPG